MSEKPREVYFGGQAVIEGVMMRGRTALAVAVRAPSGQIVLHTEPLDRRIYASRWSRVPFLRGLTVLWDALVLGIRTLIFSANVALEGEEAEFKGPAVWGTLLFSLILAVSIFFVLPTLIINYLDQFIASSMLSNLVEGLIRLAFFLAYIALIGLSADIRRVFAYHGAEHKTINAYEQGAPLDPAAVQRFPTAHLRCGTSFLLLVFVVAILLFALLGRPPLWERIFSRLLLIPVIVGLSYEFIRFSARHAGSLWLSWLTWPGLLLQRLTTREPDDGMVEVAIAALRPLIDIEGTPAQS